MIAIIKPNFEKYFASYSESSSLSILGRIPVLYRETLQGSIINTESERSVLFYCEENRGASWTRAWSDEPMLNEFCYFLSYFFKLCLQLAVCSSRLRLCVTDQIYGKVFPARRWKLVGVIFSERLQDILLPVL